ncbi:DUF2635 domain-containing protein [Limnobacter sp.]|uniref:DUF2635 domain-containing protein n=1 Tax=Limnobacter sp. TaxID=2003368 RepID=UPI00391CEC81
MMKIYPVEGRLVRDPVTGRDVTGPTEVPEDDSFWIRRLADGDVTDVAPKTKASDGGK